MDSREVISELIRKIVQCEEPYTYEDWNGQYYTRWGKVEKYLLSVFDAKEQRIAKLEEALREVVNSIKSADKFAIPGPELFRHILETAAKALEE